MVMRDNGEVIQVGCTKYTEWNRHQYRVYSIYGISPCLNTCGGGGREPKILTARTMNNIAEPNDYLTIPEATKQGYAKAYEGDSVNISFQSSKTRRGKVGKQMDNTLDTGCQQGVVTNYRIRKLTPRECFRLMGVDDADIDKIQAAGISNSQQYKMAGNSIVVDTIAHILRKLYVDKGKKQAKQLTLF